MLGGFLQLYTWLYMYFVSPHYILIILTFLDWFSARTSAKLPIMFACFAANFSWMLKKYEVNRFPSKPWQDYLFWFKVRCGVKVWLSFQSINQSIITYFTVHKCMPKNFQGYLGNKVTFLKWEDNGLLLANFIEFFCRAFIRHCYNKFRKLIAKYSCDSEIQINSEIS